MKFETRKAANLLTRLMLLLLALAAIACFYFGIYRFTTIPDGISIFLFLSGIIWAAVFVGLYLQSFAWYTYYELQGRGIFVRGVYRKHFFEYQKLDHAEILGSEEAAAFVHNHQQDIAGREIEGDIPGWFKSNKNLGEVLAYSTVPFVHSSTSAGHERNITGTRTYRAGRFVLLDTKEGRPYLLSPVDPERFTTDLNRKISLGSPG
jgi:hypothetical protein